MIVLSDYPETVLSKPNNDNDLDQNRGDTGGGKGTDPGGIRKSIKKIAEQVQADVARYNKYLKIKAGAGRVVDGIINLPESV
mgnify:CR=1 FL=1